MDTPQLELARRVAARFSQLPEVEAIAIAGSQTSAYASTMSDVDIYIYSMQDIPADARMAIGREFSPTPEQVDYWGSGVEWDDAETGIHIDTIYFKKGWMEEQVERCVLRHEAWLGYTTAFWHTVRQSQPLFDRSGWFARLKSLANQPYPDALAHNIVRINHPVLRKSFSSYRRQIEKAASRNDLISLNHRIAGFFASYFDIIFAVNHLTHPGEKRLIQIAESTCSTLPDNIWVDVERLLRAAVQPEQAAAAVDALVDGLERWLTQNGMSY
jgi:hypothetical protein